MGYLEKRSEEYRQSCSGASEAAENCLCGLFLPRHTDQIHPCSAPRTSFRTVSEGVFSEVGPSGYFQKAPAYSSTTCFRVSSISKEKRTMPLSLPLHSK
jgi:hypothetical protein